MPSACVSREEFRDTKNVVLGRAGLLRSQGQQRLQAPLLIGHIAQMADV
jgi:hypothetical protein